MTLCVVGAGVIDQSGTKLKQKLPSEIAVKYVLGGLAPDTDEPMPIEMQQTIASYWQRIEQQLGTRFNHDFWRQCEPRRSTYPACRAVLAARKQNAEQAMITAIQQAYYLNAKNPSNIDTLAELAEAIGLDRKQFIADIHSEQTQNQLLEEIAFSRQSPIQGFPSLALMIKEESGANSIRLFSIIKSTLDHIEHFRAN